MTQPAGRSLPRRTFLGAAAGAAATGLVAGPLSPALALSRRRVVVLGGGMGGLAAAHELAERGFDVTVVEPKALGGKARSIPVAGTGSGGRRDLPGEHGFRFFPGFYKNIPDTMSRIPVAGNSRGVLDHLVDAHQQLFVLPGGKLYLLPTMDETGVMQGAESLITAMGTGASIPPNEIAYFLRRFSAFLTSCEERRVGQWEYLPWSEFTNSANFSPAYQTLFGEGLTKSLVAAKGTLASTRTVALMGEALIYAMLSQSSPAVQRQSGYGAADRLLDLPTNEAWIDPWVAHLRSLGVRFVRGRRAKRLVVRGGRLSSVVLQRTDDDGAAVPGAADTTIEADWFVCAMPVEQMVRLLNPDLLALAPELGRLRRLRTDWMNGIQFFLNRPPGEPIHGHYALIDSPWALTAIDQGLFWRTTIRSTYGDGRVTDIFSVDVSDWFAPGILYGKPAVQCTREEIAAEVWAQLKRELNSTRNVLSDDMLERWFLDPAIHYPDGPGARAKNREPLLINTAGSLDDRPSATTGVPNLFLAADYVRTGVDLATMEGANDAGRQAANAILRRAGSSKDPAPIWGLWQPRELAAARAADEVLYRAGLPNALDIVPSGLPL